MLAQLAVLLLLSVVPGTFSQTVYLAGDSTMAAGGGGGGTNGWGQYLAQYLTIPVINKAIAGRSARSYTEEGRFTTVINTAQRGDYVIIEFGHNDGSSGSVDNGRQDAHKGDYNATMIVTNAAGYETTIHSFTYYIQNAVTSLQAKGAIPIVSSQTPDNIWTGSAIGAPPRFVGYMKTVGASTGAVYVDHYNYVAQAYDNIGKDIVTTYYPLDHTHTSPTGADIVAEAFVKGLLCGSSTLKSNASSAGLAVPNGCL